MAHEASAAPSHKFRMNHKTLMTGSFACTLRVSLLRKVGTQLFFTNKHRAKIEFHLIRMSLHYSRLCKWHKDFSEESQRKMCFSLDVIKLKAELRFKATFCLKKLRRLIAFPSLNQNLYSGHVCRLSWKGQIKPPILFLEVCSLFNWCCI